MGGTSRPWPLWQRLFWVGFAALACWLQLGSFVEQLRPRRDHPLDFFQEWASARNYLTVLPVYLSQRESYTRHLGYEQAPADLLAYNAHPPTSVLLAVPFALLDYPDAFLAWNLLSLLALVGCLALTIRGLNVGWSWWAVFPTIAILLLSDPFRQQVLQGQLNLFLALLLTAAWWAERRGSAARAGVWLGAATALKLFPGFLVAYAAWRGRWRTALAGAGTFLLLTALTAGVLGTDCYRDYVRDVLPTLGHYRNNGNNISLIGLWGKLFNPNNPWAGENDVTPEDVRKLSNWDRLLPLYRDAALARAGGVASAAVIALTLAWVLRPWRRPPDPDSAFALTMTAMLLVSPITWPHYALLLFVPLGVHWVRLPAGSIGRCVFWAAVLSLAVNLNAVFDHTIPGGRAAGVVRPAQTLTVLSFQTYALLALFALLLRESRRSLSPPPQQG
jgi:hypothetical protein